MCRAILNLVDCKDTCVRFKKFKFLHVIDCLTTIWKKNNKEKTNKKIRVKRREEIARSVISGWMKPVAFFFQEKRRKEKLGMEQRKPWSEGDSCSGRTKGNVSRAKSYKCCQKYRFRKTKNCSMWLFYTIVFFLCLFHVSILYLPPWWRHVPLCQHKHEEHWQSAAPNGFSL